MKYKLFISAIIILIISRGLFIAIDPFYFVAGDLIIFGLFYYLSFKYRNVVKELNTDTLTGVYNRKHLFESLNREIQKAKRQNIYLSFCIIDIDDFKDINDSFGHFVGDDVLKEFSGIVLENIRSYDIFTRLGGEEFALIISDTDKNYAHEVCERVRCKVARHIFSNSIQLTISLGVATFKKDDNIDTLYEKADKALYESKFRGKNHTTIWENGIIKKC